MEYDQSLVVSQRVGESETMCFRHDNFQLFQLISVFFVQFSTDFSVFYC